VRYHVSGFRKRIERELHGTPDDHPALHQLAAEVRFLDERREARRPPRAA
jgi:HTH-type transcriptional regulator/antitoxin HipB